MDVSEATIAQLQDLMARGEAGAEQITHAYLARIDEIDRGGPQLRSVIETNPDALVIARALDRERRSSGARGPLHGIPILVKDNIDTGDGMTTTAGSLALLGHRANRDAHLVERLRAAGAVVLGKTNMSEWAYFRSTRGVSGWSSRGGQVRNPHALDRNPCGSSSGSGAAVAAGLAPAAIGTETDGSITCPASVNGVVGFKPTVGLVGRSGIIPVARSQDTAGPMTLTVEDAAFVLTAIAGSDPRDPATAAAEPFAVDFQAALDDAALRGARIGVARNYFGIHDRAAAIAEEAVARLEQLGAEIVDGIDLSAVAEVRQQEVLVLLYEIKAGVDAYLAEHPDAPVRSLEEVVAYNREHADAVMPYFGQELLEMALTKTSLDEQEYREARAACLRRSRDEGIDAVMGEHALDAIVAPTTAPAWVTDPIDGDRILGLCSSPAAMAGYPHVTVPAGDVRGLPVGLSFFAQAFDDGKLLAYAHAFERATRARRRPSFASTVT